MNVLILGSGGRESALSWKLTQSDKLANLYIAPGNAGTADYGTNVAINPTDFVAIKQFCIENIIHLVVVGPEDPLVKGVYDILENDPDLPFLSVIGMEKEAATLEGSKAFAKEFMAAFDIPTAAYQEFTIDSLQKGIDYIATQTPPIVLKADGLAAGKGVLIIDNIAEAQTALEEMLNGKFGAASKTVVIEQFLDGIEFSVFAFTDGKDYKILPIAKDYKRIGEGDTGLNTGGMGAISPVSFIDETLMEKVESRIVKPTIDGLHKRGYKYRGFVFFGLIKVGEEPMVIEYNVRLGDPETEVVLPRLKSDLLDMFLDAVNGDLAKYEVKIDPRHAATVMLVSGGYPEAYEKGKIITLPDTLLSNTIPFHAGTKKEGENIVTNGGRVLAITSYGKDFTAAVAQSKTVAETINFEGKYYRTDIGFDLTN